jgi:hypothetical protein
MSQEIQKITKTQRVKRVMVNLISPTKRAFPILVIKRLNKIMWTQNKLLRSKSKPREKMIKRSIMKEKRMENQK